MQPLVYLGMRTLIAWLQFMERKEHAFKRDTMALVAVGALHCWAVAYALFISVHNRAMRFDGYQEFSFGEYTDHLPDSVLTAENITLGSIWIWLLASFLSALKSIVEEEASDLPIGKDDQSGSISKFLRSPNLSSVLALANTAACFGLFLGILLLCVSMAIMKGGITACEVSLALLSFAFALPHACLALQRVAAGALPLPQDATQAAAAEAASLAPQLCVILSLADSPGHAYIWQNCLYVLAALGTVATMVACAAAPRVRDNAALPPDEPETFVCLIINAMTALVLVLSYPDLNTWLMWLIMAAFVVGTVAGYQFWKDFLLDWLGPVFVVRGDTDKKVSDPIRDNVRQATWIVTLLCGAAAVWDIVTIPPVTDAVSPNLLEPDNLMLRWTAGHDGNPGKLLEDVAGAMGLDSKSLVLQNADTEHRVVLFKHIPTGPMSRGDAPVSDRWRDMAAALPPSLAGALESGFPHVLNSTVCGDETVFPPPPAENETAPPRVNDKEFGGSAGAHAAYEAACTWKALQTYRALMRQRELSKRLLEDNTEYMLRWLPQDPHPTTEMLMAAVAAALEVKPEAILKTGEFETHRLVVFEHKPASLQDKLRVPALWRSLAANPLGDLKEILEPTFPTELNFTKCTDESVFPHPGEGGEVPASAVDDGEFGGGHGAYLAYQAACHWKLEAVAAMQEALRKLMAERSAEADSGSAKEDGGDLA